MELHPPARAPPRPGTGTSPAPGRCRQDILNHPALTGMDPADLAALAAALDIPFRARREQHSYARRGRGRVNAVKNGAGANGRRKLDLTGHVLAPRLRGSTCACPLKVIGALLGVDRTTVSHATSLHRQPARQRGTPLRPPPRRPPSACAPSMTCANTPPATASPSPPPAETDTPQMTHYDPRHTENTDYLGTVTQQQGLHNFGGWGGAGASASRLGAGGAGRAEPGGRGVLEAGEGQAPGGPEVDGPGAWEAPRRGAGPGPGPSRRGCGGGRVRHRSQVRNATHHIKTSPFILRGA